MAKRPSRSRLKKVKVSGGTLTYGDKEEMRQFVKGLRVQLTRAAKAREAKAVRRSSIPGPNLSLSASFVAFIDILGFGAEIQGAKTQEQLERAYAKIKTVQAEFQKPSATDDPEEASRLDLEDGRRVLALSDAVVVVITPDRRADRSLDENDLLGFSIYQLILAQARCAVTHGIFVRGGISHGPFFFEDDILLSPALARAYELESDYAEYPLIVLAESTRRALLKAPKNKYHDTDTGPTPQLLAKHGRRKCRGEQLYFLDYASTMVNEDHRGWSPEDRQEYLDAIKDRDQEKALAVRNRRYLKDSAYFLKWHRLRLEEAYYRSNSERVRKKYRWLMGYHNRSFRNELDYLRDEVIDLSRFRLERQKHF